MLVVIRWMILGSAQAIMPRLIILIFSHFYLSGILSHAIESQRGRNHDKSAE